MRRSKADAEQTRLGILDAAERLFCARGIAQTTLEQVAREAGATRGAIYWHFKDKTDVLKAIYERYKPPQLLRLETAANEPTSGDPLDIIEATGFEFLQMIETNERQQRLHLILQSGTPGDDTAPWRETINGNIYEMLRTLMQRASDAGQLSPDISAEEAAISQMVMVNGLIGEWQRSGRAFSLTQVGNKLLRHLTSSLRAN
ncbi:TetR family transcriptional regulator [Rhodobacter sp. JA431]|uniref:TetR family transcriptional regulator n=1 Tax=Rhodobacter sp. JA431 TaxID=570013 RepID=UPI000BCDB5B7|nr:TetR family transcriptional regulator [Rhodobacter sp. JA431]SOC15898.1 TetR family transcriptional regulator [Rhodobacter sp. JA431]